MSKKKIFISHISAEKELARAVQERLEIDFLGLVDVFMSSDTESIAAGARWLTNIEAALKASKVLIILCSGVSIQRPWINFETGLAWGRGIPIVPLCHGGLEPRDLPMPLSLLHGAKASEIDGAKRVYKLVADTFGCKLPKGGVADFVAAMAVSEKAAQGTMEAPTVGMQPKNEEHTREEHVDIGKSRTTVAPTVKGDSPDHTGSQSRSAQDQPTLTAAEKTVVKTLATKSYSMRSVSGTAKDSGLAKTQVNVAFTSLMHKGLVAQTQNTEGSLRFFLTSAGRLVAASLISETAV